MVSYEGGRVIGGGGNRALTNEGTTILLPGRAITKQNEESDDQKAPVRKSHSVRSNVTKARAAGQWRHIW
jgi:hypothetical protein